MAPPTILHMLTPLPHVSPFDVNMALDAGFQAALPYINVEEGQVGGLVQDAIFSRSPKAARRTAIFIGGRNAIQALDMLEAAKAAMVPPFAVSVFADPAGSFTTAAAMVAVVQKALSDRGEGSLEGQRVAVFGATGVVGFSAAVIAAQEGANAVLVGYDGPTRVERLAGEARERFGVQLEAVDGSSDERKNGIVAEADVVLNGGRAGVQVLTAAHLAHAGRLRIAADVNAVPPAGIEGVDVQADSDPLPGTPGVGVGALTIGNVKYGVEAGMFARMLEAEEPVYLDFREAYALARERVG